MRTHQSKAAMNNSNAQFSIKAVKVAEVICVLRIIGQLFIFIFFSNTGYESYRASHHAAKHTLIFKIAVKDSEG